MTEEIIIKVTLDTSMVKDAAEKVMADAMRKLCQEVEADMAADLNANPLKRAKFGGFGNWTAKRKPSPKDERCSVCRRQGFHCICVG